MEFFRQLLARVRARYDQDEANLSDTVQAFLTCYKGQVQESHQTRELILSQARAIDPDIEEELRRDPRYTLETPISFLLEGACLELAHEPQVVDDTPLYHEPTNIWPTPQRSIRPSDVSKKRLWVFEYDVFGRRALFVLLCPAQGCQSTGFHRKPIGSRQRGLIHLRSHDIQVSSEMEMVYRYARVIVGDTCKTATPSREWARRHNQSLLRPDEEHLLYEVVNLGP